MKRLARYLLCMTVLAAAAMAPAAAWAGPEEAGTRYKAGYGGAPGPADCFESREGYTSATVKEIAPGVPDIRCSPATGGVIYWVDPFTGTIPMGKMEQEADYSHSSAVVRPRIDHLNYYPCTMCHNGTVVPYPKNKQPRLINMHQDIVANSLDLKHGRGEIWCLDCHNPRNRDTLIDHRGREVSFNQPQKLCGKCHGQIFQDWRDGIHGKRIGEWKRDGKKRWWVCTECHNPHTVQVNRFEPIAPEPPPALPKTMKNADHERGHGAEGH
ncbi:MAG: cytochrome c3 family protein [Thermodesulfobacteriota bacterium]